MPRTVSVPFTPGQAQAVRAALTGNQNTKVQEALVRLEAAMEGQNVLLVDEEPEGKTVMAYGQPSVQSDPSNYDLVLQWRKPLDFQAAVEARVPIEDIPHFLRQVANAGSSSVEGVVAAIGYGECATCKNTRLVDVQASWGGWTTAACPDCREGRPAVNATRVLSAAPVVGKKIKDAVPNDWFLGDRASHSSKD